MGTPELKTAEEPGRLPRNTLVLWATLGLLFGVATVAVPALAIGKSPGWVFGPKVSGPLRAQIKADLHFLETIRGNGASPIHQQIFGSVEGAAYKKFFEDRIFQIDFAGDHSPGVMGFVSPFNPNVMNITNLYVKTKIPMISRLSLMIHEARHTEEGPTGGWPHAVCPEIFRDERGIEIRGFYSGATLNGDAACDTTELGAYGTGLVMLKNLERHCVNCSQKIRMDAGFFGDDLMGRIIDADARERLLNDLYQEGRERARLTDLKFVKKPEPTPTPYPGSPGDP